MATGDVGSGVEQADAGGDVFTRTAPVPRVPGGQPFRPDPRFVNTGVVPAVGPAARQRAKAPLALRVGLWLTALLLVAGVAGLVIHQVRPAWLHALQVGVGTSVPSAGSSASSTTAVHHRAGSSTVAVTTSGLSANVSVRSGQYSVVVSAEQPCWVQVNTPASFSPLFSQVIQGGGQQTFKSANGQLTLELGASHVSVQVEIADKVVPGFSFTPPTAPFTMNFATAS